MVEPGFPNYRHEGLVHAPMVYRLTELFDLGGLYKIDEVYEGVNVRCSVFIRKEKCEPTMDPVTCLACLTKPKEQR